MRVPIITLLFPLLATATSYHNSSEYEYIIVGSGPGGGTLAANLARSGHSVFLIEAGGDNGDNLIEQIPAWSGPESRNSSWAFFVNHYQNTTQARRDNKYTYLCSNGSYYIGLDPPEDAEPLGIFYPRGATLGGSSQVNAMNFAIPPDNEWQQIADLTGDDSWLPQNMRQYFIELERNKYVEEGTPDHGFDGYINSALNNVSFITTRPGVMRLASEVIRSLEGIEVEMPEQIHEYLKRDMNRGNPQRYEIEGVYNMPLHVDEFRRRSGARNYIAATLNARYENGTRRYPLTVSYHSLATRVLFTNGTEQVKPQAIGVEYLLGEGLYGADRRYNASSKGVTRRVKATREVIVAGGAFNTPQILKLSGIGPRKELESLGIDVVVDLPAVGNYMQDNYETGVSVRAQIPWENNPIRECHMDPAQPPSNDPCFQQWLNGQGPYTQAGAPLSALFRSSVSQNADADLFLFGGPDGEFGGFYPGYSSGTYREGSFYWAIVKMQVGNAAGTVTLRSSNPRDPPIINFNYFDQNKETDLLAMSEGVSLLLDVFDAVGAPYGPFEVVEPPPDRDIRQGIMDHAYGHHVTSTCRMGPKNSVNHCVDSKFRVNGVDRLRIVDASIFPRTPGGFPVAPTFMISRKAFHAIIEDLGGI